MVLALARLKQQHFDLLLTDIELPGLSGLDLAPYAQQQQAATKSSDYIKRALAAGGSGFLLKDAPIELLCSALRQVQAGKRVIDTEARHYLSAAISKMQASHRIGAARITWQKGWFWPLI